MSEPIDEPFDIDAAIARGECWSCGECVPWQCPNCGDQCCNWFDERCRRCGCERAKGKTDPRAQQRLVRELNELRRELDAAP